MRAQDRVAGLIRGLTVDVYWGEIAGGYGVGRGEVLKDVCRRGGSSSFELVSWVVRWLVVLESSTETGQDTALKMSPVRARSWQDLWVD